MQYRPHLEGAFPSSSAAAEFDSALRAMGRRPEQGLCLCVDVPFCAARCLCCARPVQVAKDIEAIDDYVAGLVEEARLLAARVGSGRDLLQLHLGGGSANELGEAQVVRLLAALQESWRLPADAEMSLACDPRRTGPFQFDWLAALGFRQVTFGVLDLDPVVQRAIGRLQSAALVDDACRAAREASFDVVALHLTLGLPHQTEARWIATLRQVVEIAPDRIVLGCYRHRPSEAPVQHAIDAQALPETDECTRLGALTARVLGDAGYRALGADEFVLDTDELTVALEQRRLRRNLIDYTGAPPAPVLGLGAGARSEIDGSRFVNESRLPLWREAVGAGRLATGDCRLSAQHDLPEPFEMPLSCNAGGFVQWAS